MSKILIIGGCGYIGSSLFEHLNTPQHSVDTIDLEWFGNRVNKNNLIFDYKDMTKEHLAKYDVLILLAGHSSVAMGVNRKIETFQNNIVNFMYLIDKISPSQKFIYASSSVMYGNVDRDTCSESDDVNYKSSNLYDLTKQQGDQYTELSGLNYYALRFGTVNGFSKNFRTDIMINAMYHNSIVNGEVVGINTKTKRPILDIRDLCRAVEAIIHSKEDKPGPYNLGSFNATVGEISSRVAAALGVRLVQKETNGSPYSFFIDSSKFKKAFDFEFKGTVESIVKDLKDNDGEYFATVKRE
jgi:nucleoside-diphosphate-sugar epimerase